MKRIFALLATFFVSSPFVSYSGIRLPSNTGGTSNPDPNPGPVIPGNIPLPVRPAVEVISTQFSNSLGDSFSGIITVSPFRTSLQLDMLVDVQYVVLTNEHTGRTFTEWVYRTTSALDLASGCNSNGRWRIEIVSTTGQHYVAYIMVNNSAFGPLVPCDWIDGEYNPNGNGNMGPF